MTNRLFRVMLWPLPLLLAAAGPAAAQTTQAITVTGHYDNAVGSSDAASQGVIGAALLKSRPSQRPGEVLEFVPGLIVTQHSGDSKANQYFLRGFNLDHGTDFATSVDGIPVNVPTHAHGQGYTDLNFLLPELVQRIEYRKGPYFAKTGDFGSAGSADIVYARKLDEAFGQVTLGGKGYRRGVAGTSFDVAPGLTSLGVLEEMHNDGPWTVPERLRKTNGVLGLSGGGAAQGWRAPHGLQRQVGQHRPDTATPDRRRHHQRPALRPLRQPGPPTAATRRAAASRPNGTLKTPAAAAAWPATSCATGSSSTPTSPTPWSAQSKATSSSSAMNAACTA